MSYGVFQAKTACTYIADDTRALTVHHTADVQTAGAFVPGAGASGNAPGRKYLHPRHICLKGPAGQRCRLPIGNSAYYNGISLGLTGFAYGGLSWTVTGKVGERTSE